MTDCISTNIAMQYSNRAIFVIQCYSKANALYQDYLSCVDSLESEGANGVESIAVGGSLSEKASAS